ncbi:MAG: CoA pyrophosphatase [Chloroflexi bacterium]|nr:CoA pyrophosphatase [Chloroflexota bacterium]
MEQRLKQILAQRQKYHVTDGTRVPSAVLIPIFVKDGEYHILFTKRTERVRDHKGQISFPGGACETKDATPFNTALRESTEEIGLQCDSVQLLGELDDTITSSSPYVIYPFVATIPWPQPIKADPVEVDEVFWAPISALLSQNAATQSRQVIDGQMVETYTYEYDGKVIWGATARILNQLLGIWAEVASVPATSRQSRDVL